MVIFLESPALCPCWVGNTPPLELRELHTHRKLRYCKVYNPVFLMYSTIPLMFYALESTGTILIASLFHWPTIT